MLSGLFRGAPVDNETRAMAWPWFPEPGNTTWAGINVSEVTATQLLAVYGCAAFITDEISTLPLDGMESTPAWVESPSDGLDRISWTGQIVWSLVMSGDAFCAIINNDRGQVLALDPIDPAVVEVRREAGRRAYYIHGIPAPFEVLHIPGRMKPGALRGMNPVEYARQSIGLGLASMEFGAKFFDGEGNMPGVIELPTHAQPETMRNLAEQWRRKRSRSGKGLPGVLENGATWKPTGVTNEQAQFLATRKYSASEIAGQMFLLDPSDLGIPVDGTSLTYANLGQRNTRRVQVTLLPWIRRIESALSPLVPGGSYRFNLDARLRGDTRESYETLAVGIAAGFMTIDEARTILGMEPRPDQTQAPTARELAEMIQKIYLGVGVVLTAEEARDILNSGGANLAPGFTPPEVSP